MRHFVIGLTLLGTVGCTPKTPPIEGQTTLPTSPTPTAASASPALRASQSPSAIEVVEPGVTLNQDSYLPGQEIEVTVTGSGLSESAWVGVVPSSIPHGSEEDNDSNDLGYVRIREGALHLIAPKEPGDYDARLNDSDEDGKEVASRTFKVTVDPSPIVEPKILWAPTGPVPAGSELSIEFEAPLSYSENAWIGVVPSATAHGEEKVNDEAQRGYQHLNQRSRGKVVLTMPEEVGSYDVRMFDSDDGGKEVGSVSFEVSEKPGE